VFPYGKRRDNFFKKGRFGQPVSPRVADVEDAIDEREEGVRLSLAARRGVYAAVSPAFSPCVYSGNGYGSPAFSPHSVLRRSRTMRSATPLTPLLPAWHRARYRRGTIVG
jgi:hypothetical protein